PELRQRRRHWRVRISAGRYCVQRRLRTVAAREQCRAAGSARDEGGSLTDGSNQRSVYFVRASESATTHAAPVSAIFTAFSFQIQWLDGSASSIGRCTSGVNEANMTVRSTEARRACTFDRIAMPAAM